MRKLLVYIIMLSLIIVNFVPLNIINATSNYTVKVLNNNGDSPTNIGSYSDYSEAKQEMLKHNSTEKNVAVIYNQNNELINVKYALVKFKRNSVISLYPTATSNSKYTSIHTSYASDGAFIDYDPSSNRVKVKISGYIGWTSINNVQINPITDISGDFIMINTSTLIRVRSTTTIDNNENIIGGVNPSEVHRYYEKKKVGAYTWYRVLYNGQKGWIATEPSWVKEIKTGLQTYYEANTVGGNLLHYFEHTISGNISQSFNNLGTYPSFMKAKGIYYSFDGNYFYDNLLKMLDDYRQEKTNQSLNKNNPYYPYYLYLPSRSKTGYTADDFNQIIKNKGYTKHRDYNIEYYTFNEDTNSLTAVPGVSRSGISLLYGMGQHFVDAANTYGVNSLMMFSTALNESATGTSAIAFYKNNLFGLGANDSNPIVGARTYSSAKESIIDYAKFTGSGDSSYTNPLKVYYYGTHYGNKGSGMNVNYATDPYWGEKQASNSFINDRNFGSQDFLANTIGVTTKVNVEIYKQPNGKEKIYTLKNNYNNKNVNNIPLIVFNKILGDDNKYWYKVYTDVALDNNQNISVNSLYEFAKSYGYIKEDSLYVENQQPVITANNIEVKKDESLNLLKGVKAIDVEDGDITKNIEIIGTVNMDVEGQYPLTYKVTDSSLFSVSKTIKVTVLPASGPLITVKDVVIPQYTSFNPWEGLKAEDYEDGDLTDKIEIIENTVKVDEQGVYKVVYKVVNSHGKQTTTERKVTVGENYKPEISASNKTIKIDDNFNPLEGVTATDKEDGNITTKIQVITNEVNNKKEGTYKVVYKVSDNAEQTVTKTIYVTVEKTNYTKKQGEFHYEKMEYNQSTDKLDVSGYLAIKGMNNTEKDNIKYDFIIKNNLTNEEIIKPLERWLKNQPNRNYSDGKYSYTATWFKGSLDLSNLQAGEYTLYVRARLNNYEVENLFRNVFNKNMTKKAESKQGVGYVFRNNEYLKDYPLELFVNKQGLITKTPPPNSSNMINNYKTLEIKGNNLNIVGASYNVGLDYGKNKTIERYLIFENITTQKRYTYNIGSYVGNEIPLRLSDGKSKVRGWFNTEKKVDISTLEVGNYIIYIKTKVGNVEDHGELNDIFLKKLPAAVKINNKTYSFSLNKDARFRIQLNVK